MITLITRERVTDLVLLARTNGSAGHEFASGAYLGILWSNALGLAVLFFRSAAGDIAQVSVPIERAEVSIWHTIHSRAGWLTGEAIAREAGA